MYPFSFFFQHPIFLSPLPFAHISDIEFYIIDTHKCIVTKSGSDSCFSEFLPTEEEISTQLSGSTGPEESFEI